MSQREEMISALASAAKTPRIGLFGQLTAGLVANGFTLIPQDLWDTVTRKVRSKKLLRTRDGEMYCGFIMRTNHLRSCQHEYWQSEIMPQEVGKDCQAWVIPVDEFLCLSYDDMDADLVSVSRLIFVGTEDSLRAAIMAMPDGQNDE